MLCAALCPGQARQPFFHPRLRSQKHSNRRKRKYSTGEIAWWVSADVGVRGSPGADQSRQIGRSGPAAAASAAPAAVAGKVDGIQSVQIDVTVNENEGEWQVRTPPRQAYAASVRGTRGGGSAPLHTYRVRGGSSRHEIVSFWRSIPPTMSTIS